MTESFILALSVVSILIHIVNNAINPFPYQIKSSYDAKQHGWNDYIIILTRTCSYLTIYSQCWIIIALWNLTPLTMYIAQSISWIVFFLYYGTNFVGIKKPSYMIYHPEEFVKKIGWGPMLFKFNKWNPKELGHIMIWIGINIQYTIFPFYLRYLRVKYDINYDNTIQYVLSGFATVFIYVIWYMFCRYVQDDKMQIFTTNDSYLIFYCISFILMVAVNCILASMWNGLFFYCLGIITMISINYAILKFKPSEDSV